MTMTMTVTMVITMTDDIHNDAFDNNFITHTDDSTSVLIFTMNLRKSFCNRAYDEASNQP